MLFDVDGVMTDGTIFFFPAPAGGAGHGTHEHREQMAGQRADSALPVTKSSKPKVSTRMTVPDFPWRGSAD